jgi:hypothetical protein
MEDFNDEEFHRILNEFFGGNTPKATPPRNDPIGRLNHSLENAGLGCFVSDTKHA